MTLRPQGRCSKTQGCQLYQDGLLGLIIPDQSPNKGLLRALFGRIAVRVRDFDPGFGNMLLIVICH